jgi:hypothetical protein
VERAVPLHDCPDVHALCLWALERYELKFTGRPLPPDFREEALQYLVLTTVGLAARYDPDRNDSFEKWARVILPLRVVDWARTLVTRRRWQYSHTTVEVDGAAPASLDYDPGYGSLAESLAAPEWDPTADRDPDHPLGLLSTPGSDEAWRPHVRSDRLPQGTS